MKRLATYALSFFVGTATALLLSGCAGTHIRHVNAQEFIEHARLIEQPGSVEQAAYIGVTDDRVYLEEKRFVTLPAIITRSEKPRTTVIWTLLKELPPDLAEQLKAGNAPWTPWQNQAKKDGEATKTGSRP
jgi:hypothetical protein